jgi:predicted  nucleic acid-binding Zn-ribbon protein
VLLLQTSGIWNVQGSITVVGILLLAVAALYLGLVTPKHTVEELRVRLKEREAENAALNSDVVKRIEENGELRGELAALRRELEGLRGEIEGLRAELGRYRAGT